MATRSKSIRKSNSPQKPRRKTARQKLESVHPSHGQPFEVPAGKRNSTGRVRMIVPRPLDVDAAMRRVRKGRVTTMGAIRASLATAAGVEQCCPLTTGIFARLAAEAAQEDAAAGKRRITPWWRTVRDNGAVIDKFPGGGVLQAAMLKREGVKFVKGGGRGKGVPRVDLASALGSTRRRPPG